MKIEFSPCDYFLKRDYHSLKLLEINTNEFLSYKEGELSTEDSIVAKGDLSSLEITGEFKKPFIFPDGQFILDGEYFYTIDLADGVTAAEVTINFKVPSHTEVIGISVDEVALEDITKLSLQLTAINGTSVVISTKSDDLETTEEELTVPSFNDLYNEANEEATLPSFNEERDYDPINEEITVSNLNIQ